MTRRLLIPKPALIALLAAAMLATSALAGWWAWHRELVTIAHDSADRLHLRASAVRRLIDRFTVLPDVLALDPELRAALRGPVSPSTVAALNEKLARANGAVHSSTL